MAALAVGVRVLVLVLFPRPAEVWEYDALAANLLHDGEYVYEHFGTPYRVFISGFPYVWLRAATLALWPSTAVPMLLVHAVLAAATAVLVGAIGAGMGRPRAGLLAAALTALHPGLAYYGVRKLHPLPLDALMMVAVIASVLWGLRRGRGGALLTGVVFGVAVLQRGPVLPFGAFVVYRCIAAEAPWRARATKAATFVAGALLVLGPWLARSERILGRPVLSSLTGQYLFVGNVPPSMGSNALPSGEDVIDVASEDVREALAHADENGQGRIFWNAVMDFLRHDPVAFARGVLRKLLYFWTWAPQTGIRYPALLRPLYLFFYVPVVALALAGACALGRGGERGREALAAIAALFASVSGVHAVLIVEMRHRWALEPLLLLLAAVGASEAWALARGVRERAPSPSSSDSGRRSGADGLRS